jgi:hypothetical protein
MDGQTQLIGTILTHHNGKISITMVSATTHLVSMETNVLANPELLMLMVKGACMKMAAQLPTRIMMEF